ncbi:MAG: ribosome maturation factor RimP [Lachnospiraceae bacterium]|nr:ribosome maturation factor RimP [Lachnospiraceae bacterium]
MSKHSDYEKRTEELVTPVLERLGLTLYDVEYVKEGSEYYLRIFIDKEGGVDINECEAVSREMNTILDEEDFIPDAYIFEVSSPGLGRTLKKDKHLSYSIGMEVDVHTFKPVDGTKDMTGILKGFDDEYVDLEIQGAEKKLERKNIASIKLTVDF